MFRNFLFFFAILLIGISCSTGKESSSLVYTDYRIQKHGKTDSSVNKMLEPYATTLDASMNKVIGFSLINLNKKQPESGLGNFMADCIWLTAEKKFGRKVDAGFINTGGIRSYISKGNITIGKIFELMQGGTTRNGRTCTSLVVGEYWISWKISFSNTTLPGVTARFSPTLNASSSVIEI